MTKCQKCGNASDVPGYFGRCSDGNCNAVLCSSCGIINGRCSVCNNGTLRPIN